MRTLSPVASESGGLLTSRVLPGSAPSQETNSASAGDGPTLVNISCVFEKDVGEDYDVPHGHSPRQSFVCGHRAPVKVRSNETGLSIR
jgi:hypothetical protein